MKKRRSRGGWFNLWSKKTLKTKIHNYVCKKDICCEKEINRKVIIQLIFEHYKKISSNIGEPEEYLNAINNDLVKFIGYKVDLEKNDKDGLELWKEIDEQTSENKKAVEKKIETFFEEVPLFFLLAFLGYSDYTEKISPSNT